MRLVACTVLVSVVVLLERTLATLGLGVAFVTAAEEGFWLPRSVGEGVGPTPAPPRGKSS